MSLPRSRIRIVSDGSVKGTQVLIDDKRLDMVQEICFQVNADTMVSEVSMRVVNVPITMEGDMVATELITYSSGDMEELPPHPECQKCGSEWDLSHHKLGGCPEDKSGETKK